MYFQHLRSLLGKFAMPALLLSLFPSASRAEAGELGGIAAAAAIVLLETWVLLTLFAYLVVFRHLPRRKRRSRTLLFFCFPVLLIGGQALWEYAFGDYTSFPTVITKKPMEVSGVNFQPGSRAKYEQTGGFFGWGANRVLQEIHSPHPVLLGNVPIDALTFIPNNCCDEVTAEVSENTIVDGWPCGDARFQLTPAGPALESCFLAAPQMWRGKELPAGYFVNREAMD
ncbi:hypothetical protein [Paraburkholderia caledonica]|uniref:hypothetical protein n=1 Tax=Paraburkholderia caledonica TaxID=134536 RepID=UPI000B48A3B6|nr:hypothetical protein BWU74_24815 [Burkholderia sp. Bk]